MSEPIIPDRCQVLSCDTLSKWCREEREAQRQTELVWKLVPPPISYVLPGAPFPHLGIIVRFM